MPKLDLLRYINIERGNNVPDDVIKTHLLSLGWLEKDVDEAIASLQRPAVKATLPASLAGKPDEPKKRTGERWFIILVIMAGSSVFTFYRLKSSVELTNIFYAAIGVGLIFLSYISSALVTLGTKNQTGFLGTFFSFVFRLIGASIIFAILYLVASLAISIYFVAHGQ